MGGLGAVALSHYGHFFLLAVLRHGSPRHKRAVVSQLAGRVPELVAHAEGSEKLPLGWERGPVLVGQWEDGAVRGGRRKSRDIGGEPEPPPSPFAKFADATACDPRCGRTVGPARPD